jgi:hypothetical protein
MKSFYQILSIIVLLQLSSCGLKYTPVELPIDFETRRHNAIQDYIKNDLALSNLKYESVAFGQTEIEKPISYKKLDSLFAQKYAADKQGLDSKEFDEPIANQRMIVLNDTNKIYYLEDHIFSVGAGDTIEFYFGKFKCDSKATVVDVQLNESVFLPKAQKEWYKIYLFEESFLYPNTSVTTNEKNFYNLFKLPLANLSSTQREELISHTLNIMAIANRKKSLLTQNLIKGIIVDYLHGDSPYNYLDTFSNVEEIIQLDQNQESKVIGYKMTDNYIEKTGNGEQNPKSVSFEFDSLLRIQKITIN